MDVEYSEAFKRQLKRLSRRYRQIKNDIKPIVDALSMVKHRAIRLPEQPILYIKSELKTAIANEVKVGVIE